MAGGGSSYGVTCAMVCNKQSAAEVARNLGMGANAFAAGALETFGVSIPGPKPANPMLDDIKNNLQQLQISFDQSVTEVIGGIDDVILKEYGTTQVLMELAVKSLETTLAGAIGMNTELIYFYGIIIGLLVLSEVFKRRG